MLSLIPWLPLLLVCVCTFFAVSETMSEVKERRSKKTQTDSLILRASCKPKREHFSVWLKDWETKVNHPREVSQ